MEGRCEVESDRVHNGIGTVGPPQIFLINSHRVRTLDDRFNPTDMADGYLVGFQDFPLNVLLRVSSISPMLTVTPKSQPVVAKPT